MRYRVAFLVTVLLVAAGAVAIWYGHYAERILGPSPEILAQQLTAAFAEFNDPEHAAENHPDVCGKRFPDGEWIFGVGIDSHSWKRAKNLMVLKDSRGRLRVLTGHVCGPRWLEHNLKHVDSLDEFYQVFGGRFVNMNLAQTR